MRRNTAQEREDQISRLCEGTIYSFAGWVEEYRNNNSKFICICEQHGKWSPSVNNFINHGARCPTCAQNQMTSTPERELQINNICAINGYEFVAWLGDYINQHSKFEIFCKQHGKWDVSYTNFVNKGTRCPGCTTTGFDSTKPATLYAIRSDCGQYVKIGITNNFEQRFSQLRRATPFDVSVIERIECDGQTARQFEKMFHDKFESAGFTGFDGATEWLRWSTELQYWLRLLK
mgnify:FL=1